MFGRFYLRFFLAVCVPLLVVTSSFAQSRGWKAAGKSRPMDPHSSLSESPPARAAANLALVQAVEATEELSVAGQLPQENGQFWKEYDLRPYTSTINTDPRPEQAIVDWILRETGTEAWFGDPMGVLSARRDKLRVYHTPVVHETIDQVVQRFVRSNSDKFLFGVRMMTVANANWRAKAMPRIRPVPTQTAGVEAWLMSREDAAIVLADLRRRNDYREHSSPNLLLANGRTQTIERLRPLAYVRGVRQAAFSSTAPALEMGQIDEGFSLSVSPLLALDQRTVDAVVKLETVQVERLNDVVLNTPTSASPRLTTQIQVPQTSCWRLHERFRWPADEVLLISCGVVAAPSQDNPNLFPLRAMGPRPPRVDALVALDFKGPVGDVALPEPPPAVAAQPNYRGRY